MTTQIPITFLTGFLSAGKTTLLNRILTERHGEKYAVIVYEFGETGIDNDLVVDTDEEVFEMNNGCIFCTVRGDLIRIFGGLMKRADRFDAIIVETTGLADSAPVAQTFFVDQDVADRTRLDAIVMVADAVHLNDQLGESHEAEEKIAHGDAHADALPGDEHARFARDHAEGAEHHKVPLDAILALEPHINN